MANTSPEEQLAGGLAAVTFTVFLAVCAVAIWFAVKAIELILRVLVAHPTNRPMWIALGAAAGTGLLAAATQGQNDVINALAIIASIALLCTAKCVELYYDQLLQPEWTRDLLVDEVLHQPWWAVA